MQEMTFNDILGVLRKWLALIIIVPIVVTAGVGLYYAYADDIFEATTSLYVLIRYEDTAGTMRYDTTTSNFFTSDYRELFVRSPVMSSTEEALGIPSLEDLVKIDVSTVTNTRIVEVKVTGKDPQLCASVSITASRIFKNYIEEFMQVDSVSITQEAEVPTEPSGPPRLRNTALAFFIAFFATAGCAIMVEMLNTKISTSKQIEEGLNQIMLGNVLDYRKDLGNYIEKEKPSVNNFYKYVSQHVQESVKTTAMNISFASVDFPVKSIAITSSTPNEGKSSFAILLASSFAEEGKVTLVIDMDFRKPSIGKMLKSRNRLDLMDYLGGRAKLEDIVVPSAVNNLFYVDSSHNAALLSRAVQSERFDKFLSTVKRTFDMIIFDTPPLGLFIDAAVLASKLDGAVMVVADNHVEMKLAEEVLDQLNRSGAKTLGIVLNFVKMRSSGSYYYNRRYGGYYYYSAQKKGQHTPGKRQSKKAQEPLQQETEP